QTNRTIFREQLYLEKTNRSFELTRDATNVDGQPAFSAVDLFNAVSWATAQILFVFKEVELINTGVYEEMLTHCFPQSLLAQQVRQTAQLPRQFRPQETRFGNLLENGFGLYEIDDLQQVSDREQVKFRHYAIHSTPEKVLLSMSLKNVVFG